MHSSSAGIASLTTESRLMAIAHITAMGSQHESSEIQFREISRLVCLALQSDACVIRELREGQLELRGKHGLGEEFAHSSISAGYGIGNILVSTGEILSIEDVLTSEVTAQLASNGTGFPFRSYCGCPLIFGGEVLGVIGVFMQNTPRRFTRTEELQLLCIANHVSVMIANRLVVEEMHDSNLDLDRRVAHRTKQLRAANADLEQFTYAIGHDLRSPLRSILEMVHVARQRTSGNPEMHSLIGDVLDREERTVIQAGKLIDDLLSLARLGASALQINPFPISLVAQSVWDRISKQADVEAQFICQEDLTAVADRAMVEVVLQNLFENSVKFRQTDKPLIVEFGIAEDGYFFVRDNGIGFEMKYADKLFNPMERLVGKSQYPGNGIGLATVRRIIEHHGGAVRANAKPHVGTTISFSFGSLPKAAVSA